MLLIQTELLHNIAKIVNMLLNLNKLRGGGGGQVLKIKTLKDYIN